MAANTTHQTQVMAITTSRPL
uniref:Uncharacterized protein n=1 Tax=Tetraselmis sp. GSL018 TaxID=582737 RepID=A0A061R0A0_9CHLO